MKKLEIAVGVSLRLDMQRVDFDLEYLVPLPASADTRLTEIVQEYGRIVQTANAESAKDPAMRVQ
jgi:hypothetical protein